MTENDKSYDWYDEPLSKSLKDLFDGNKKTIHYQIYELTPSFGDGLICEGADRDSVIREAVEWRKDVAAGNDVTEWELDAKLVEMDWDNDVILSEKNIYKCGVLN